MSSYNVQCTACGSLNTKKQESINDFARGIEEGAAPKKYLPDDKDEESWFCWDCEEGFHLSIVKK